ALPPEPPQPITLIRASYPALSSANSMEKLMNSSRGGLSGRGPRRARLVERERELPPLLPRRTRVPRARCHRSSVGASSRRASVLCASIYRLKPLSLTTFLGVVTPRMPLGASSKSDRSSAFQSVFLPDL